MSRRAVLALLALGTLVAAHALAAYAATVTRDPSPWETALAETGARVERATGSVGPALQAGETPALVVLVHPPRLLDTERALLRGYVERGGALWMASPVLDGASLPIDDALRVLPGVLYAEDGGPARVTSARGDLFAIPGAQAIDLRGGAFSPLLSTSAETFRDVNGNARVDRGEPAGPFVAAAAATLGEGRIVAFGASSLPPEVIAEVAADLPADARVVLLEPSGAAWLSASGEAGARVTALPALFSLPALAALLLLVAAGILLLRPRNETTPRASAAEAMVRSHRETTAAKPDPSNDRNDRMTV